MRNIFKKNTGRSKGRRFMMALAVVAVTAAIPMTACENGKLIGIGIEAAKAIAADNAGLNLENIDQLLVTNKTAADGSAYYEVALTVEGLTYNYRIDAESGEVTKLTINDQNVEITETIVSPLNSDKDVSGKDYIGKDAALEIALSDLGKTKEDAQKIDVELDFDDGKFLYETEFYIDGIKYEYEIVATDGTIYTKDVDGKTVLEPEKDGVNYIGAEEAKKIALADAGLTDDPSVVMKKAEFEKEKGVHVYEVEFVLGATDYEYTINAQTGAIVGKEVDGEPAGGAEADGYIGLEKAKEIALAHAGLTASDVFFTDGKLDVEHGVYIYEVEFETKAGVKVEYEYEINAKTGQIIKAEMDTDD